MKQIANMQALRSQYVIGFGLGTIMTPLLLVGLGEDISTKAQYIVWTLGVLVLIAGAVLESRAQK